MKKSLAALAVLSTAAISQASLLVYDGFDYPAGQALLGQTNPGTGGNWLRAGSTNFADLTTVSGSLPVPPALGSTTGGALSITGNENGGSGENGTAARLALPSAVNSGTVYYSFVMRVDSLAGSNNNIGAFFVGLNNTSTSSTGAPNVVGTRLQMRIDPGNANDYDLGIFANHAATASATSWSGAMPVDGSTVFVVAAYTFNTASSNDDISSLWINPTAASLGAASAPAADFVDSTNTGTTDLATIASIILRQSTAPYLTMDELRVGTTWADVTLAPEPAPLSLLGLGTFALLRRRRTNRE